MVNKSSYFYVIWGGSGLIGSNIVENLVSSNIEYLSIDIKDPPFYQNSFLQQNLSSQIDWKRIDDKIKTVNKKGKRIVLINLASSKIPFYSDRYKSCYNNVRILNNSIEFIKRYNSEVIYTSTNDIYGFNPDTFEDSNSILGNSKDRRWSYAASKIMGEHLYLGVKEEFKSRVLIIRVFGCMGKYCNLEVPWQAGVSVAIIYDALTKGEVTIDCPMELSREYIDVEDFVDAMFFVFLNSDVGVINIGLKGNPISVKEIIDIVSFECEKKGIPRPKIIKKVKDVSDILHKKLDSSLLETLGWKNKIDKKEILKRLFDYIYEEVKI